MKHLALAIILLLVGVDGALAANKCLPIQVFVDSVIESDKKPPRSKSLIKIIVSKSNIPSAVWVLTRTEQHPHVPLTFRFEINEGCVKFPGAVIPNAQGAVFFSPEQLREFFAPFPPAELDT